MKWSDGVVDHWSVGFRSFAAIENLLLHCSINPILDFGLTENSKELTP